MVKSMVICYLLFVICVFSHSGLEQESHYIG